MTTPIVMLALLIGPCLAPLAISTVTHRPFDGGCVVAVGPALMFIFMGVGQFIQTEPMARMLPPWVPARTAVIYLTGILGFVMAAGFFIPKSRRLTSPVAAAVLIVFFPGNVYAAMQHIPMGATPGDPCTCSFRRRFSSS